MPFTLKPLPYDYDALAPHMSADTLKFHHDKHHQKYVDTLNDMIKGTDLENATLEEIIRKAEKDREKGGLFSQAGQVWNHDFFWESLSPKGGGEPSGPLAEAIASSFGGLDKFKEEFKKATTTRFGSGWAWLVMGDNGKLEVMSTLNGDLPLAHGKTALLTCDVWEHAYYLDYQNRRPDFVDAYLNKLVNWDFAASNFAQAKSAKAA